MSALRRKLLRDLWHMRGQLLAIATVVACGVATVVTTRTAYVSLSLSQADYYTRYRFADVFARLKRAPEGLAARIRAIPGVDAVSTRVVFDATLDVPGLPEPATGRIHSIPEGRAPVLNDFYLRKGRSVEPGRRNEVLVSEAFAEANALEPGDTLGAVLNGRWERLRIVGIALSPEYVYEISGADLFPDNRHFGVLWMSRDAMGAAFSMEGAFNDVSLRLAPGASEAEVIASVDRLLDRYGGLGAYGRKDQLSARFLSDELNQNRVTGTVVPGIFLGVAAFLLHIVLTRLVGMQREQIGALKAFGYGDRAVAIHYLQFAFAGFLPGALAGTALGLWLGAVVNANYVQFYRFPVLRYEAGPGVVALALAVSGGAALLAALGAVRRALLLPPAEAMRPEPPPRFHAGFIETLGLRRVTSFPARMILRGFARRPARALLAVLGIALAVAILVVGRYFFDAIDYLRDVQFRIVQRDDVTLTFQEPRSPAAIHEAAKLAGVLSAEPYRAVPVRVRFGHRTRRVAILGLPAGATLRRPVDERLRPVALPPSGAILTTRLAEILHARPGDRITVEVLEGERPVREVRVAGVVNELIGLSVYMDIRALHRVLGEDRTASGVMLSVDRNALPRLYQTLKKLPAVSGVTLREAALRSFEETLAKSLGILTTVLVLFACAIAFAMVYNAARIALSERGRELASLRVLGFTRGEVARMLLGEQAILTALAIPLGWAIGTGFAAALSRAYQWELFRLPLVVSRQTYAFSLGVVVLAALASGLLVRRRLDRLDLVAVLKTRE